MSYCLSGGKIIHSRGRHLLQRSIVQPPDQPIQIAVVKRIPVQLLLDEPQMAIRVRRRHVHAHLQLCHVRAQIEQLSRAVHIDADRQLQFLIEAHRCGRMEHDVHVPGERAAIRDTEAETGQRTIAGQRDDAMPELGHLRAQRGEHLIVEDLIEAGVDVEASLRPHQQIDVGDVRAAAQQFVDQHFAHEAC